MLMVESIMAREAEEAVAVVARLLDTQEVAIEAAARKCRRKKPQLLLTNARGSSDHAGVFAKYNAMTRLALPVVSASPSIYSVYAQSLQLPSSACLSISQSGQSPDIVSTAQAARAANALTVTFTNATSSPLAAASDNVIDLCAGHEKSVAATKSFIASLTALLKFIDAYENRGQLNFETLPDTLSAAWELNWSKELERLSECRGLYVIGRGPSYGIAREAALKFKETCQIHAEAYSAAECAHGPLALLGPDFPALVFVQNDGSKGSTIELVKRMLGLGAPVFLAGASIDGAIHLPVPNTRTEFQPIAMIMSFYRAVAHLAHSIGKNPDSPPALEKVTRTL